ncbi:MAG: hypothetical protein ACLQU1_33395 [Bryobacteraceae bacterium]
MPTQKLTNDIVTAAILGFEEQKRHIDTRIAELRTVLSGGGTETGAAPETPRRKRRKINAAGRARIAEAQRKRWAESRKPAESAAKQESPKPKRRLSAAGRKAISEATKRRWALKRAEATKAPPPAAKKTTPAKKAAAKKAAPVKKAAKKTAPAPAPAAPEAAAQ